MKVLRGLFFAATVLAALTMALVPDSGAQFMCPGNTQIITIHKQTQVTQYYQQMQMQQQQMQMQQQQMQQQMMAQMQMQQQAKMQQQMQQKAQMSQKTATMTAKFQAQPMHMQCNDQMMQLHKQNMNHTALGLDKTPGMMLEKNFQTLNMKHTEFQNKFDMTLHSLQPGLHGGRPLAELFHFQQMMFANRFDMAKHSMQTMISSKVTPHLLNTQQEIHKMQLAKLTAKAQLEKHAMSMSCTFMQAKANSQTQLKSAVQTQTALAQKLQSQTAIEKSQLTMKKTDLMMQLKPVTKTIDTTETIVVSNQNCAQCHHHQQQPSMIAKHPQAQPQMIAKPQQGLPQMLAKQAQPQMIIGKQPMADPTMIGKQPQAAPVMIGQQPKADPVMIGKQPPAMPMFMGRELVPVAPPPLVAVWPKMLPLPQIVQKPLQVDMSLTLVQPPYPLPQSTTMGKGCMPTMVDQELPANLRKQQTMTTALAKQTTSSGMATLPSGLAEPQAEAFLRTPSKLTGDMPWQAKVTEEAAQQSDTDAAPMTTLSEHDLQQPPQRFLSIAVVQMAPAAPVADKLPTEELWASDVDLMPTKRDPLNVSTAVPVAPAPSTASTPLPQVLQMPGAPTARDTELIPR
jgi:hypothetical protein